MLELYDYVQETRKQIHKEQYVSKRKVIRPSGMPDLSSRYEKVKHEAWESKVEEPNLEINADLGNALSTEELLIQAVAREGNKMYDDKRLNTESIQKMLDPTGYQN